MFVHRNLQLFLLVDVDDFRVAGRKENISKMWVGLNTSRALELAASPVDNTYLGCNQSKYSF